MVAYRAAVKRYACVVCKARFSTKKTQYEHRRREMHYRGAEEGSEEESGTSEEESAEEDEGPDDESAAKPAAAAAPPVRANAFAMMMLKASQVPLPMKARPGVSAIKDPAELRGDAMTAFGLIKDRTVRRENYSEDDKQRCALHYASYCAVHMLLACNAHTQCPLIPPPPSQASPSTTPTCAQRATRASTLPPT